jgi:4-amino-4-deoxy-L-arabinose transferase-like glycosyltransferase
MEMLQNHNYIIRTYQGMPEQWETKPPFLIWLQVVSLKVFGCNELAIRIPVMISTWLTVLLLIFYFHQYHKNRYIGYLAALVLVTSQGYIDRHIARTGDHDALLILLLTAIVLIFYRYINSGPSKSRNLLWIALLFAVGVLTKSVAALFILPGLLVAAFIFGSGKKLFSDKWLYMGFVAFVIITGSYYGIREHMQPGYLQAVWQWELLPRYANSQSKFESATFWYYAINLFNSRFTYWIFFLIPSFVLMPFVIKGETRKFYVYLLLNIFILFLILSLGTKNLWYDGPLYPLFAMIIGIFLYSLHALICEKIPVLRSAVYTAGIAVVIFIHPYAAIVEKVSRTAEYPWDREYYSMPYLLRNQEILDLMPDPLKIVFEGYNTHLLFYMEAVNFEERNERLLLSGFPSIQPGDAIIISQQQMMDSVERKFNYEVLFSKDPVKVLKINHYLNDGAIE